jgi:HD-GYP domain-containing protein (c-di-GMP phosphodiesterase class II)
VYINTPEYVIIYEKCLVLLEEFIDNYQKNNLFDKEKLEIIIKKMFELVEGFKNDIIAYMGVENDSYDFLTTHSVNSAIIALIGGYQLKLDKAQLRHLGMAGLLHDIGMMKIPKNILNKTGKLSDEEYKIIKSHPITAFKEMNAAGIFNQVVLDAVLQHQEQFDGNGYPRKLKGINISLYAKILAISDTFEAQISPRAYRKSKTSYMAMKSVLAEAQNKFDPKVLRAFLTTLSIYPPGTLLQMNDNSVGTVISINPEAPLRPQIKIIIDEFGEKMTTDLFKDLKDESELFIVKVLNKEEYQKK